jgi:superfamily II RNA helicase
VLDEVHYLGDPHRGTVWEECVIYCPRHVQLLCLSATVGEPHQLSEWIAATRGQDCALVTCEKRPVPLKWLFSQRPPREVRHCVREELTGAREERRRPLVHQLEARERCCSQLTGKYRTTVAALPRWLRTTHSHQQAAQHAAAEGWCLWGDGAGELRHGSEDTAGGDPTVRTRRGATGATHV